MPSPPAPPPTLPREQQFALEDVAWEAYIAIGNVLTDRPALRLTYDRGRLELMTTSPRHERYKYWLGRFLDTIAEELSTPIVPGGSMTFQRKELERGFEMDECYWIANELAVREKLTWDPAIDPPPDVAIEIELSRSVLNRLSILAAFKVPEVWCYDGTELRLRVLQADGSYQLSDHSVAFPDIPVKELVRFLPPAESDFLKALASVRAWVRSLISKP